MAYINPYDIRETSFWCQMAGLDTNYKGMRVCTWYLNGSQYGLSSISPGVSRGGDIQFRNLKSGTTYQVRVTIALLSGGGSQNFNTSVTTEGSSARRPYNWAWYSNIASGQPIRLSALEWNHFCDRINEFREYAGLSGYRFSRAYSGDSISASTVNQAYYAISDIFGRGRLPSSAVRGGRIEAYFFNQLKNALNDIP